MRRKAHVWLGMVLVGAGCSTLERNPIEPIPPPPPPPTVQPVLEIVSGNNQVGVAGQSPLFLQVKLTSGGKAVPSRTVTWSVQAGLALFNPVTGLTGTDLNGIASVGVLPTGEGNLWIRAEVSGVVPVIFTAVIRGPVVTVVSGDPQESSTGDLLAHPLVVRVTDDRGHPIPDALVVWRITQGTGEFTDRVWQLDSIISVAGADGLTSMTLRPYSPGIVTVEARVENVLHDPAVFTVHTSGPFTAIIRYGPPFDCGDPSTFWRYPTVPIRVGYRVIFENIWCPGRLRAVSVPPGATSFASDPLPAGSRFAIVVVAAGVYVVEDALNTGMGSFAVGVP